MKKHLIVGPLPPSEGGVTLLFKDLVCGLNSSEELDLYVVNINHHESKFRVFNIFLSYFKILFFWFFVDSLSFHLTSRSIYIYGPAIIVLSFFRKKIFFRKFAGSFDLEYEKRGFLYKIIVSSVLNKSSVCFLETKYLVKYFSEMFPKSNIFWFPNHRPIEECEVAIRNSKVRKYLYLGSVNESKGILILVKLYDQVSVDLPEIDFYGYADDGVAKAISDVKSLNYKGVIDNSKVSSLIKCYDYLILPTIHDGEGIPGVIIEAMSFGVPVLASNWRSIPEIVNESNGFLFDVYSHDSIRNAILFSLEISDFDYKEISRNAFSESKKYNSYCWVNFYLSFILK